MFSGPEFIFISFEIISVVAESFLILNIVCIHLDPLRSSNLDFHLHATNVQRSFTKNVFVSKYLTCCQKE